MRNLGYNVIYLVQLIRFFGAKEGASIFRKIVLAGKNSVVRIKSKKFKNEVEIRKGRSDLPIFYQIFCELQYDITYYLDFEPKTIIDCGSNVGYSCLYFASLFPNATIVAIEPQKDNYNQLRKNLAHYENVEKLNAAVWYKQMKMLIKQEDDPGASFEVIETDDEASTLVGITIQDIAEKHGMETIDILKIDIEGAEYDLFQNNPEQWLERTKCLIIELHDLVKKGTSKAFFKAMSNYDWNTIIRGENIICFKLK